MIKHALLTILFFTSSIVFSQEISITNNLPASASAGEGFEAQYTLTKGSTMGSFAKFQLDLPAGFQAQSTEIKGGNFTFENNRVKIVWVSLPGDASFAFTFKVIASSAVSGNVTFAPQFFYLENSVKKEYNPAPIVINFGGAGNAIASDNTSSQPITATENNVVNPVVTETHETTTTNPSSTNSTDNAAIVTEVVPSENNTNANSTSNTQPVTNTATTETAKTTAPAVTQPIAKSNVVYHVQLAALTNKPTKSKFAEYGAVQIVEENGLYKVMVGNFKTLEEGRKYKAQLIAKGTTGCFVVAYENGVHIKI